MARCGRLWMDRSRPGRLLQRNGHRLAASTRRRVLRHRPRGGRAPAGGGGDGDDDGGVSGSAWLSFGSHMGGIKLIPLAARAPTARRRWIALFRRECSLATHVSRGNGRVYPWLTAFGVNAIEASYIHHAGGWFYLYANWDMWHRRRRDVQHSRRPLASDHRPVPRRGRQGHGAGRRHACDRREGRARTRHPATPASSSCATRACPRRLVLSSHYYLAHGDGRGLSFLQWHELEYVAAGWPRLGARHVPKLRL